MSGLKTTTNQAQKQLSFPCFVKAVQNKSEDQRKRSMAVYQPLQDLRLKLNRLIDEKTRIKDDHEDGNFDDGEEQLDDFNEVFKDLEENGWYKGQKREVEKTEYDWNDGFDFIKGIFKLFSERVEKMSDEGMEQSPETPNGNTEWWMEKELEEHRLLLLHERR